MTDKINESNQAEYREKAKTPESETKLVDMLLSKKNLQIMDSETLSDMKILYSNGKSTPHMGQWPRSPL